MRVVTTLALCTLLAMAPAADSRAWEPLPLTIRLYNSARIPDTQLATARETAMAILRDVAAGVRIRACESCDEPLGPSEVVVRVIPAPAFSATLHEEAFGVTYVVRDRDRGWLATVFADRVDAAAARAGVDAGRLLGRVMAHEVGHLLLGVHYHGPVGVMRALWTDAMLAQRDGEWRFSPGEAERVLHRNAHP